eukprot:2403353-Prymnesium_polylepis.1
MRTADRSTTRQNTRGRVQLSEQGWRCDAEHMRTDARVRGAGSGAAAATHAELLVALVILLRVRAVGRVAALALPLLLALARAICDAYWKA